MRAAYFPEFFRVVNVPVNLVYGEWAELAAQVHERKLDVLAGAAGVPFPSFIELEAKDKVRYVAFTANEIAALRLAMPELTPSQLPDDLVYQVVRAVFENQEEMMEANAAAAETIPSTSSATPSCRCIPARFATTARSDAPDKRTRRVPSAESRFCVTGAVKRAVLIP